MFRYLILALLFVSVTAHAMASLRFGSKVLTIGDSALRVQELMGEPALRTFVQVPVRPDNQLITGEQWQYADDGKTIVITIVNGRATHFETLYP